MAMKTDEISFKDPIVDLFYPTAEKRAQLKKRRVVLESYPQDYVANLELERVAELICPHYQYRILRMFGEMCCDEEVIAYRCDILEDFLEHPALAETVRKVIEVIVQNDRRSIYGLNEPDSFTKLDSAIEAFDAFVKAIDIMHDFYEKHGGKFKSAGVKKLFDCFEQHHADKSFATLKKELEQLKQALKDRIRSVTVGINLDERLVPVSAGIVDYSNQPYTLKPSLFDKIIYHGAKFPEKNVVKSLKTKYADNEYGEEKLVNTADEELFKELSSLTDDYIRRINKVMAQYQKIGFEKMFGLDYQLEYYLGAVKLIELCRSAGMGMCRPKILPAGERRADMKGLYDLVYFSESRLWNLRHKDEQKSVVPNDIELGEETGFYLLTGANNGGKTTFIRGLGICYALAQLGMYVPAESCELSPADFIFTHFPKEEQTGINTSRFTTEIKEFKTISDAITDRSLLLMNESIQSTTPQECVEIAEELVRIFCIIGVRGVFATHLTDLAEKCDELNADKRLRSKTASIVVCADEKTGERLYKIKRGLPQKTSCAYSVFKQFGIDIDAVAERAAKHEKD